VAGRQILDAAGFPAARIVASGSLDELEIERLVAAGAPIDVFGVGTRMGVSADAPYLDSVYKLVEYDERPVMKLSTGKVSAPSAKQVQRRVDGPFDDIIALADEPVAADREGLLVPVMEGGRRGPSPEETGSGPIASAQARLAADLQRLPPGTLRLADPVAVTARASPDLQALIRATTREIQDRPD
jgi:nicotinate phosphoribosyltransferase